MEKKLFAQRNGYKVENTLIGKTLTEGFRNGIINMFYEICHHCHREAFDYGVYGELDRYIHTEFLRQLVFTYKANDAILSYMQNADLIWYDLFSLIECCYDYLGAKCQGLRNRYDLYLLKETNRIFERENYVYRLDKSGYIIEVTSELEISSIDETLENPIAGVKEHISTALQHLAASQKDPDYRNSIKESISAVEACCRYITKESTLDRAISKLESKGIVINSQMKKGFENLYYYTNDGKTGIRHSLMDDANAPTNDEAIFMLVSCSAFVNYLTKKGITIG